jgi:hypothetical protein
MVVGMREIRNGYKVLLAKPKWHMSLSRPTHKVGRYHEKLGRERYGLDSSGSG